MGKKKLGTKNGKTFLTGPTSKVTRVLGYWQKNMFSTQLPLNHQLLGMTFLAVFDHGK